jgi:hypothetical protein
MPSQGGLLGALNAGALALAQWWLSISRSVSQVTAAIVSQFGPITYGDAREIAAIAQASQLAAANYTMELGEDPISAAGVPINPALPPGEYRVGVIFEWDDPRSHTSHRQFSELILPANATIDDMFSAIGNAKRDWMSEYKLNQIGLIPSQKVDYIVRGPGRV